MKLPKTFRCSCQTFTIQKGKVGKDGVSGKYMGRVLYKKNQIRLNRKLKGDPLKFTLMHELVHIMMRSFDLPEGAIDTFALALIDVIQDNDWFPKYFKEDK